MKTFQLMSIFYSFLIALPTGLFLAWLLDLYVKYRIFGNDLKRLKKIHGQKNLSSFNALWFSITKNGTIPDTIERMDAFQLWIVYYLLRKEKFNVTPLNNEEI